MRTSVLKDDPGYKNFAFGKYNIFLDGRPVRLCITADEEEGFVLVHAVGDDGKPYLNETRTETVKIRFQGKVEIQQRKDWQPEAPQSHCGFSGRSETS
jgi:hypothetical protein